MKIASIVVASMAAFVADAQGPLGAKATKETGEEVFSMSMPAVEQDFSMSVPLFEAEISMPIMSMPEEPVVAAKARKLRTTFGRRIMKETRAAKATKTTDEEEETLSMSVPLAEQDLSMSLPLFGADIDISLPLAKEPKGSAKARKLHNNFGRRIMKEAKAEKVTEEEEEVLSMSMPAVQQEFSMSVPLFEAEISMPIMSMPEEPVVAAKARKLRTTFGRRIMKAETLGAKATKETEEEELSMSAPLFDADISLLLVEDLSMSAPLFEADISLPMSMPEDLVFGAKALKRV